MAALLEENDAKCNPPLDAAEIKKIAASVSSYAPDAASRDHRDDAEQLLKAVLGEHFQDGKHLIFAPDGGFWNYTGKFWSPVPEKWVHGRILETIQGHAPRSKQNTSSLIGQVSTLLKAKLAAHGDPLGFVADPLRVINCSNGELWIGDDGRVRLKKHSPESHLRYCLDVVYDPKAKCPQYDRALLEIFSKSKNPKVIRRYWNELVGYIIQSRRNIPLIIILLGGGDNGKTMLAKTIIKLMGPGQVQSQRVEALEKNRFAMGSLLGKLLFLDDDVQAGTRLPDGILKTISEAKEVTGENKYKSPFNFVVRTVPMLLCNNVPSLADVSHGMLRRLRVIPFDRTFTDKDKDDGLFDRIWADELPDILNRALQGYRRLLMRGRFKVPKKVIRATNHWLEQANPVPAFIDECCTKCIEAKCLMKDLYPAYEAWAKRAGFTKLQNQLSFRRNLEHLGFGVGRGNQGQLVKGLFLNR